MISAGTVFLWTQAGFVKSRVCAVPKATTQLAKRDVAGATETLLTFAPKLPSPEVLTEQYLLLGYNEIHHISKSPYCAQHEIARLGFSPTQMWPVTASTAIPYGPLSEEK
eukprot:4081832-Amphidinium_carterae.1